MKSDYLNTMMLNTMMIRAVILTTALATATESARAVGVLYADPGWTYAYDGNEAYYNDPDGPNPNYTRTSGPDDLNLPGAKSNTAALVFPGFVSPGAVDDAHAKWLHVGSQWDGTAPGAPLGGVAGNPPPIPPAAPGGVGAFTEGGATTFLRLQDSGDPSSWGWADKGAQGGPGLPRQEGNNRKIGFAHPLSRDAGFSGDPNVLDTGITLSVRARVATAATGPIDAIYQQGGPDSSSVQPWPTNGVGYQIANGGRAPFDVSDSVGGGGRQIGFGFLNSATLANGTHSFADKTGLVINNRATSPSGGSVDTFDATDATLNVVQIPDNQLTQWQEFWITIKKLPAAVITATGNTHEVDVYANGSLSPQVFQVVASTPNQDGGNGPALGLGVSSGTVWGAFDLDFIAYKEGILLPTLASTGLAGDYNQDHVVNAADYTVWRDTLGSTTDLRADGNGDHTINPADYDFWKNHFGTSGSGTGAAAAAPEPASLLLALGALASFVLIPRRRPARALCAPPGRGQRLAACMTAIVLGVVTIATRTAIADGAQPTPNGAAPQTIYFNGMGDIQKIVDDAPPNSVIVFNPNSQRVFSEPLKIEKPLTLRGLNAKLPPNLGRSPLVLVTAEGVTIEDFQLYGNTDTVPQEKRAALIFITAGDFRVEHGQVFNSSRHGIYVEPKKDAREVVGGVIRDIMGRGNARCVVGVGNDGNLGLRTKNILIENIRCYDSELRGAVNVKDGTDNITVRDIYAENSRYAIDVQDHEKAGEINRNITVENVYALKCRYAIRSDNRPIGHDVLTVRNVTAEQCAIPIRISNYDHVTLDNIRVIDHQIGEEPAPPVLIANCNGVFVRDVVVKGSNYAGPAVDVVNSNDVVIDGFTLQGEPSTLTSGLRFHVSCEDRYSGLRVSNVSASRLRDGGILLDADGGKGTLTDYLISGNLAEVADRIHGQGALITNNAPPTVPLTSN